MEKISKERLQEKIKIEKLREYDMPRSKESRENESIFIELKNLCEQNKELIEDAERLACEKEKYPGKHPLVDGVIMDRVRSYYESRKLQMPNDQCALLFLVSEVGEFADAVVDSKSDGWVRNNNKPRSIPDEIGDVLMMLYVFAMQHDLNPYECMMDKMNRKLEELK